MIFPAAVQPPKNPLAYVPGDVIASRYRVTGPIGRGSTGAVYAACHLVGGHPLAIKLLTTEGGKAIEAFEREARLTAQLVHASTVRVFDLGRDGPDGPWFLAMEWLRGPDLEQVLRRTGPLREVEAVDLAIQVLGSLAEAHAAGLVHRDLKPANLMLTRTGRDSALVKVLDFGCSCLLDRQTGPQAAGTPAYMSPEQCRDEAVDGRADLYALAVILYRCVTGHLPFAATTPLAVMYQHLHAAPPDPDQLAPGMLSRPFRDLLLATLAKAPADRPADALQMRQRLEQIRRNLEQVQPVREPLEPGGAPIEPGGTPAGRGLEPAGGQRPERVLSDLMARALAQETPAVEVDAQIREREPRPLPRPGKARLAEVGLPRGVGLLLAVGLLVGIGLWGHGRWLAGQGPARPENPAASMAIPTAEPPTVANPPERPDLRAQAQALADTARRSDPEQAVRLLTLATTLHDADELRAELLAARQRLAALPAKPAANLPAQPADLKPRGVVAPPPAQVRDASMQLQPRMME